MPKRERPPNVWCLNTNVSVKDGLKWPIDRAIRELLLNCVDQDTNAQVKETDGSWIFENKGELTLENFTYAADSATVNDQTKNGNFGYGLKDSIVVLTALGITYEAQSNGTIYKAFKDKDDLVCIEMQEDSKKRSRDVVQILSCKDADILKQAVLAAKKQVLQFRPEILKCERFELPKRGTIYFTESGSTEIFFQNCAYTFEKDTRKPLAFVYNLFVDKANLRGRDRSGLPKGWVSDLTNLIRDSTAEPLKRLLEVQRDKADAYYEFKNQRILGYIRRQSDLVRSNNKKCEERKKDALAKIKGLEKEVLEIEEDLENPDLPRVVHIQQTGNLEKIRQEMEEQKTILAMPSPPPSNPQVIVFCGESFAPRDDLEVVRVTNVREKIWKDGQIPTLKEYELMQEFSIPVVHLKKVRELRRLLCLMGIHDLKMTCAGPAAPPITVQNHDLRVNFTLPDEKLVVEAIHTLCSPSYFRPAQGLSHGQALSQFASSLLQFAPESLAEIHVESKDFSFGPPVMAADKAFCPLLVDTAWNTKAGGISAFNIQLAEGLAGEGCTVYVAVTDSVKEATTSETQASWDEAKQKRVIIVTLSQARGNFIPELDAGQAAEITHIIGHAHITGKAAAQMHKLPQLAHTRLWQFNHVLPREVDPLKDYMTPELRDKKGREKDDEILKLNRGADFVWSVGQMMFTHFQRDFVKKKRSGKHKQIILPLNPRFLQEHSGTQSGSAVNVLFIGRTEDVIYVKGVDIAQRACEYANNHPDMKLMKKTVALTIRGLTPNMEVTSLLKLLANQAPEHRNFQPFLESFAAQSEIQEEFRAADIFIMPSRLEPFGLVATEAIAAAVPVLVSENSGVAQLLQNVGYSDLCITTSKFHPTEVKQGDIVEDRKVWGEAIVKLVKEGDGAFARAVKLKNELLEHIKPPYAEFIEIGKSH